MVPSLLTPCYAAEENHIHLKGGGGREENKEILEWEKDPTNSKENGIYFGRSHQQIQGIELNGPLVHSSCCSNPFFLESKGRREKSEKATG